MAITMLPFICMLIIQIVACSDSERPSYSLYRVTAFNNYERQALYEQHIQNDKVIFLNGVTNDAALPMDVMVHECCTEEFEMNLQDQYIEYINIDSDQVQEEFNGVNNRSLSNKENSTPNISESFLDWDNFIEWVNKNCKNYGILEKIYIGSTYEKRDLLLLKVSTGGHKPAVCIIGGEQGRDWMSTAIILNFIKTLLENPLDILLNSFEFYFMPIFNPDGYYYTMKHDRFWNKNRKEFFLPKICSHDNNIAVGVNADRNWFLTRLTSVSDAECLSVYIGNKCLTEEETKSLSIFLNNIATNLLAFINLRGYENLITVPYAESYNLANNEAILMEILLYACSRVKSIFNVTYKFSSTSNSFFNFTGNVADWVKMRLNVPIVYTMYMKQEHYIFPHLRDIIPLSDQFTFMAQEMLVLGSNIYGPLFSKQINLCSNMFYVSLICLFMLM